VVCYCNEHGRTAIQFHRSDIPRRWERTPASVKRLVEEIAKRARQLEEQLRELQAEHQLLQEQVNRTSANSSQPPSQDPPKGFSRAVQVKAARNVGPTGHKDMNVGFIRWNKSQSDHYPEACWKCGTSLVGEDPSLSSSNCRNSTHRAPSGRASISPVSLS